MTQEASDFTLSRPVNLGTVAVLADGENLSCASVEPLMPKLRQLGSLTILRAYCDRMNPNGWDKDHRFQVTYLDTLSGKNSADIRLVIDAMDIAHAGAVSAFVLLSTDRDFAALAHRLRASGFWVVGAGRSETSLQFQHACSEFHILPAASTPARVTVPALSAIDQRILKAVRAEAQKAAVPLAPLGSALHSKHSLVKTDCGCSSWSAYFRSKPDLYVMDSAGPTITVRIRID